MANNKQGIAETCAVETANVAIAKMREILQEDASQFNCIWIPTIEDHEQTQFPDRYECQLVYFVRDMLETANPEEIKLIVQNLLVDEHCIFKRLAYHLINHHYDVLSQLFWNISYNPLNSLVIHEIYELFKTHCKNFDEIKIETILNWIETQDHCLHDKESGIVEKEEEIKAYYKKEWLFALLDTGNKEVMRRYEKYNLINDATIEHPGFHVWSSGVHRVKEISPIDENIFKKMKNDEIAAYINSYTEENLNQWNSHVRINLASSVRRFVFNDPMRFSTDLTAFLSIPRKYQYEFLGGFEDAWRNDKDFNWNELLAFMKQLIENDSFWSEEKKAKYDYKDWIVNAIANLIQEGTRNDKHAFDSDLLPMAEDIILLLLKNVKGDMNMIHDLLTSVLNSSKGKVFTAAINYSLRYARLYHHADKYRWVASIKSEFTMRLDKSKEPELEFSVVIGEYLPNLDYLDKQWVADNVNKIFDLGSDNHWEAAFSSYIIMTATVYENLYKLLRDNGHYEKGLSFPFSNKDVVDKLVQNIVIGYLAGWDDLVDINGLLYKLLNSGNIEFLSALVFFMRNCRENLDDNVFTDKIKPLWKAIIEKIKAVPDSDKYRIIKSKLAGWLSLVDTIDSDIDEWLQISIKSLDNNWFPAFFIEELCRHVKKTPMMVGNLYLKILEANIYPDYKMDDIISIVQTLYNLNEKDTANRICNIYCSNGFEFLRDIFEKYNQNNVT